MSGLFSITVQEARGFVAAQADIDKLCVFGGCSSTGSGLSSFFLSGATAVSDRGVGDAVDALAQTIEQRQSDGSAGVKFPAAMYTLPVTTDGTYGTVDESGVTGTAITAPHSATKPLGRYQVRFKIETGGFIGTAGITFQYSLDGGVNYSNTIALGTDTTYLIPNSGAQFDFTPSSADLTALNTLINDIVSDYNEHVVLTTGAVHGAADTADQVSVSSASDTATRIAAVNAVRAAYALHRVKTAGGVHGAADNTNVITAVVAFDDSTSLMLALDLKAKINAHMIDIAGGIHGLADASSTITAPAPSAGAFIAGDIVACRTFGPLPSVGDVDTMFVALAKSTADFSIVALPFDCTAAMLSHVTTGLDVLAAAGKQCVALCQARNPDFEATETEQDWADDLNEDFSSFIDSRIVLRASYGLLTDAMTTRQYLRSDFAQFVADVVRVDIEKMPDAPADRPEANFVLTNASGALVGHDEGPLGNVTGLSNPTLGNRLSCVQRLADPQRRNSVFWTVPWVMYAADERIRNLMVRRIANAIERDAVSAGTSTLGQTLFYNLADPNVSGSTPTLTDASRNAIHAVIFGFLSTEYAGKIQNADDGDLETGLVQIASQITVSGGNLVSVSATLAPRVFGILLNLAIVLAIQE